MAIASFVLAMMSIPTIIVLPVGCALALAAGALGIIALPLIGSSNGKLRGTWMAVVGCSALALHLLVAWVFVTMVA